MDAKEFVDSLILGVFAFAIVICFGVSFQSCKQAEVQIALNASATKLVEKCYEITKDAEKCFKGVK